MRLFDTCPARLAAAVLTDTAELERTHTDLKKFGIFTNQRKQAATLHVHGEGSVSQGCMACVSSQQGPTNALTAHLPPLRRWQGAP